jgi:hypothetical protein
MRKIEYIFIDSDCQINDSKSRHHALPNFGYHFVVNSQGLVLSPTSIDIPAKLIPGPIYDRDKYNKCSICIRYCGSLRPEAWLIDPNTSCKSVMQQRAALLNLNVIFLFCREINGEKKNFCLVANPRKKLKYRMFTEVES